MRHATHLIAIIALTATSAAWVYDSAGVTLWVGDYELLVQVERPAGLLLSVSGESFAGRDDAEEALADPRRSWPIGADPFGGSPLAVPVRITGRESGFGRKLGRAQHRYLAVVGTLTDGRRVGTVADIPGGGERGEVVVVLP